MKFRNERKAFSSKPHKQNFIARLVNQWFDRVVGAMKGDGLSDQEEQYGSHQTTRDFIWNSVGAGCWSFVFPVVTMVSTQLVGVEQAGQISMAFVVALLLMFVGNFGTRAYQASDIKREHSFMDYQVTRWVTCIAMLLLGWWYCTFRGYTGEMASLTTAVLIYRCIDAVADVYEGRLQQCDKLYLAGISQAIRSVLAMVFFSLFLLVTLTPSVACWAMAIVAGVSFVVVTVPLALLETEKSHNFSFASVWSLIKITFPLFIAIFLFNVIENMPKLMMEGVLNYDAQLFFNALYFPAQCILIIGQLVYKPLILRMADVWQDDKKRRKFDLLIAAIMLVIVVITVGTWFVMATIGIPVMSFMYGVDFEPYRRLAYVMIVTGGVTCAIDFVYQVITVMRRQKDVTTLYCVTFGFSLFIPWLLIGFEGLDGAILSYLIIESILLVLLVWEYFRIRGDLTRESQIRKETAEKVRKSFLDLYNIDPGEGEE
ncbi:MAG: lipopolysaccharide biosynthesis protein [Phoenicibacter congonensis]|uniref:Lipopolysaccharide biosynthesis protein n=1 Tax=Phoenicibacter congonensis TaxID=1944646 RepID=A0AA43RG80_9ACTN|nr:lipopolysaccharide biosynthesis protein [Phoenicibacter congonensis]